VRPIIGLRYTLDDAQPSWWGCVECIVVRGCF